MEDVEAEPPGLTPLDRARAAAAAGDAVATIKALYEAPVFDGFVRKMRAKWRFLGGDADLVVSDAVYALYNQIQRGHRVDSLPGFLWKVGNRIASQRYDDLQIREEAEGAYAQLRGIRPLARGQRREDAAELIAQPDDGDDDAYRGRRDRKRAEALRIARAVLTRLGHVNAQRVIAYVLDAVEAERPDVSYQEIADALGLTTEAVRKAWGRGFSRLERIVRDEGLVPTDFVVASKEGLLVEEAED